jgi:hypothetical protein
MGLRCSCGVRTNPIAVDPEIFIGFFQDGVNRRGPLTLTANICADTPELSTFTASFVDLTGGIRSFVFTSTTITAISCDIFEGECIVTIMGMGLVTGELTPRQFTVRFTDRPSPLSDTLNIFTIVGFSTLVQVGELQPDLTFFGCPTP